MMGDKVTIGDCTLYCGDSLEILPQLEKVDAVVTDPPYGINQDKGFLGSGGFDGPGKPIKRNQYKGNWDAERPDKKFFDVVLKSADHSIIFGGNFFTDLLPVGRQWFVWDKKNTMPTFGDCELVWTNIDRKSVKLFTYEYNGLIGKRETRVHPTQKPVEVMKWCIKKLPNKKSIIDPFMGSGTTGVACAKLGLRFVGIELDKNYFNIACKRIETAYKQPDLFIEPKTTAEQVSLDI